MLGNYRGRWIIGFSSSTRLSKSILFSRIISVLWSAVPLKFHEWAKCGSVLRELLWCLSGNFSRAPIHILVTCLSRSVHAREIADVSPHEHVHETYVQMELTTDLITIIIQSAVMCVIVRYFVREQFTSRGADTLPAGEFLLRFMDLSLFYYTGLLTTSSQLSRL